MNKINHYNQEPYQSRRFWHLTFDRAKGSRVSNLDVRHCADDNIPHRKWFVERISGLRFPSTGMEWKYFQMVLNWIVIFHLTDLAVLDDIIKELSTRHIFHDHENVGRGGDHLIQLDDMRMIEELQVLNLAPNLAHHIQALDLLTIQNLHRHFVTRHLMETHWNKKDKSFWTFAFFKSNTYFNF